MLNRNLDGPFFSGSGQEGDLYTAPVETRTLGAPMGRHRRPERTRPVGIQRAKLLQRISERIGPLAGALMRINTRLSGTEWTIVAPKSSDQWVADFVTQCIEDMDTPFDQLRSEVFHAMVVQGASFHEITLRPRLRALGSMFDDAWMSIADIAPRPQTTIQDFVMAGDRLFGIWQNRPDNGALVFIPRQKLLHITAPNSPDREPRGRSWLTGAEEHENILRVMYRVEALGAERNLAGLPYMTVPVRYLSAGATEAEKSVVAAMEKNIGTIRRDESTGLVLPAREESTGPEGTAMKTGFDFGVLTTGANVGELNETIKRHEQAILQVLASESSALGVDSGSRALGETKEEVLDTVLKAATKAFEAAFTRQVIHKLMIANNIPIEKMPKLVLGDVSKDKVEDAQEINILEDNENANNQIGENQGQTGEGQDSNSLGGNNGKGRPPLRGFGGAQDQ